MKLLRKPEFYLGLIGLSVALWFAFRAAGETSPGVLSAVHAQVPELVAEAGCAACHGEGLASLSDGVGNAACLACHENIQTQRQEKRGLHALQAAQDLCGICHAEHQGAAFQPVNTTSFKRLGILDALKYDHNHIDYNLVGQHEELKCALCHEHAQALVLEPGQQRFLGLRQDCVACHEDVHEDAMGSDCASCHGQEGEWELVPFFEHTERFELIDVHSGQACAACHGGDLGPSVAELALQAPEDVRSCAACHDSPHAEPFVQTAAEGCIACHNTEHPGFDLVPEDAVRPVHDSTAFALVGPHKEMACDECHSKEGLPNTPTIALALTFEQRHPGRSACIDCHADPHGDAFAGGRLAQALQGRTGCVRCHTADAETWAPVESFEHLLATGFDLVGAHDKADCTACHEPADGRRLGALIHSGQGESCSSCHEDPHSTQGRGSVSADLRDIVFREQDCHACHNQVDFKDVPDFDHDRSGWPLVGVHERTECVDCHGAGEKVRLAPAREQNVGPKVRCVECHEDPHGQRFDSVAMPQVVEGREGCERCHGQESFRELPGGRFDHGLWTAFGLRGAHNQVRCSDCHGVDDAGALKLREFDSLATANPISASVTCEACHEDPHGSSFQGAATPLELHGKVGCARCHGEQSFRETPGFEHEFTGYPLEGAHADLSCVACHGALAQGHMPAPRGLARLLPAAGRSCVDCHSDPHAGQFQARSDPSCAACHSGQTSFLLPDFDHAKTRFPLDEVHEPLDCSTCHQSAARVGGMEVVRYRPLGIECVDCHGSVMGGSK